MSFVQDTVHLGVKLKARLLTYSQLLPLGKYSAQPSHLSLLQSSFCKEQHNLRAKDLDHQNFEAVLRVTSENVMDLLDEFPDAKGTKAYLQVLKSIIGSYLNKDLDPISRIKEAWFALFFVRYWRQWLLYHDNYTLERNFISLNSYICIELNAHALVILLLILRDRVKFDCYFPWLLGSQPCERAFCAARSMSPTFSTMINFTILGLLRRLHKFQIQIDLESTSDATGIIYPRHQLHKKKIGINDSNPYAVSSITNKQIEEAIKSSLERAKAMMDDLGMKDLLVETKNWDKPLGDAGDAGDAEVDIKENIEDGEDEILTVAGDHIPSTVVSELADKECSDAIENLADLEEKRIINGTVKEKITYLCRSNACRSDGRSSVSLYRVAALNDASAKRKQSNNFLAVHHKGEEIFIRKTTLVWLFQEGERVSTDRLFRVRDKQPYSTPVQQKSTKCNDSSLPQVQEYVELGDICVFQENVTPKRWSIGRITPFANYKESLKSDRQYKSSRALVESNVGALCTWFECSKEDDHKFYYTNERSMEYIPISKSYVS